MLFSRIARNKDVFVSLYWMPSNRSVAEKRKGIVMSVFSKVIITVILVVAGFLVLEFSIGNSQLEKWGWYGRLWLSWRKLPFIVRFAIFAFGIMLCILARWLVLRS
jgi:hypothetical protein